MTKLTTIYGKNKTFQQLQRQIADAPKDANILITRLDSNLYDGLVNFYDNSTYDDQPTDLLAYYDSIASLKGKVGFDYIQSCHCAALMRNRTLSPKSVAITSAGLADRSVDDEAGLTVMLHGYTPKFFNDIGVNTLNKTMDSLPEINKCETIISVQGFEGALPVVLAGLTSLPIIAVPTATGYGVASKGYTALNTALSSCTSGIATVNIGNGFGAGEMAVRILDLIK